MDFRIIPVKKRLPDQYDSEESFIVPVTVIKFFNEKSMGQVVPVLVQRLDFFSGRLKYTRAITFKKSIALFEDLGKIPPFQTDAIVHKKNGKLEFKVIGAYNTGLLEDLYSVQDYILDNDEDQIRRVYESNYQELRKWVGNLDSNISDLKEE
jgi:hypothetical protein